MESKVVRFVFFIVLLYGCVNSEVANDTSTAETGELIQQACDCGSHGKCSLVDGRKVCHCDYGFAVLDENCEVCNCGSPQNICHFNRGFKECECADGHYEQHGQCEAIPMLNWEVREKGAYYIIFRYFPRNGTTDFGTPEIVLTSYRNVHLDRQPLVCHYTYVALGDEDVTIILDGPGTYEFRCRVFTKLGNSSYTEWYQWHWNDASNFTGAPEILRPRNDSYVAPGRITTEWRAQPDADEYVTSYKVVLLKRISITNNSWRSIGNLIVDHVVNKRYYNTTFYDYDTAAFYKLSVTSRGSGYESNVSSPVYFRVKNGGTTDDSFITRNWVLLLVTVPGSVLGIVLFSLCIYCCVKKRKQTV